MNRDEAPKFKSGYCTGELIPFYYIPEEHRVQYAKPAAYIKSVRLYTEYDADNLRELKNRAAIEKVDSKIKRQNFHDSVGGRMEYLNAWKNELLKELNICYTDTTKTQT